MSSGLKQIRFGRMSFPVKAVGFDKDGTLFESVHFWHYIDTLRLKAYLTLTNGRFADSWSRLMGFSHPDQADHNGVLATATMQEEILLVAGLLYTQLNWPWPRCKERAAWVFESADTQMQIEKAFLPKQGVPEVFDVLKSEGVITGIMTSDQAARTEACMDLLGIRDRLDFIVTPEEVRRGKPAADMVHAVCGLTGIQPHELAVVGDSVVDLQMAKAAGSYAIGFITYEGSEQALTPYADALITSITDIKLLRS